MKKILAPLKNSSIAILPIVLIVVVFQFAVINEQYDLFLCFLIGSFLVIIGQTGFLFGIDSSILTMGEQVGSHIHKLKRLPFILIFGFVFGVLVTLAEPSVQVLANQINSLNSNIDYFFLVLVVGLGVGIYIALALVKMLFNLNLKLIILISYLIIFILLFFIDESAVPIAFDSGGVTTGPITVPFVLALGLGIANIKSNSKASDSFGMIAMASIGPIIAVLILSLFYPMSGSEYQIVSSSPTFLSSLLDSLKNVAFGLGPLFIIFLIFNFFFIKLPRTEIIKIAIGSLITFFGLVLFLTGVNYGLSNMSQLLGRSLAIKDLLLLIMLVGVVIAFLVVYSEPAISVLGKQVESATNHLLKASYIKLSFAISFAFALILSVIRVYFEFNILFILIPLYLIALVLQFIVDDLFSSIAFDSGGIATGPMSSAFIVPFVIGIALGFDKNPTRVAFGTVALIAIFPIVTILILGLVTKINRHSQKILGISKQYVNNDYNFGDL